MLGRIKRAVGALYQELRGVKLSATNFLSSTLHNYYSKSTAGPIVNQATAMQLSTVWSATRLLSETPATLPFELRQKLPDGGSRLATEHPAYHLTADQPNPEMTWVSMCESGIAHLVKWGNWFLEIERDRAGFPVNLWPLLPDRTWKERDQKTRNIQYRTNIDKGKQVILPPHLVLHTPGLGFDGLMGYSVITMARNSMGAAMATEEFGANFFANGISPSGVLVHPGELGDKAHQRLNKAMDAHRGLENSHRHLILEEGMKFEQNSIPPEDAQFLQTRQFGVIEMCRWFRVPPHMVYELSRSTNNNIEHQGLTLNIYTFRPWYVKIEKQFNRKLLTKADREVGYYFKFNEKALLRGDFKTRQEGYAIGRQWGYLSADDIRELEDMPPLPDGQGKIYLNPMNMTPAEQLVELIANGGKQNESSTTGSQNNEISTEDSEE